ncbi:MAG: vWA domain-containing protein [Cytophagales bacterium]|nr:vWA domain-containing protein [Cytophagales bacterium]
MYPYLTLIFSITIGIAYASFLYYSANYYSKSTRIILFAIRTFIIAILSYLLWAEPFKQIKTKELKPVITLAIDNSVSIQPYISANTKKNILNLQNALINNGYEVNIISADKNHETTDNITYNSPYTDIDMLLRNAEATNVPNHAGIILISDGLHNRGEEPAYLTIKVPVHTIGIGDSVEKKDVYIRNVYYNKYISKGNIAVIKAELCKVNVSVPVTTHLIQNNKILQSKISEKNLKLQNIEYQIAINDTGIQQYTLRAEPIPNEYTTRNNSKDIYIEVINDKKKILIACGAPHPDIKALKTALSKNLNMEVDTYVEGIDKLISKNYHLVIYYQLPSHAHSGDIIFNKYYKKSASWFIIGTSANVTAVNNRLETFALMTTPNSTDKVYMQPVASFTRFKVENIHQIANIYPPVVVPFGSMKYATTWEPIAMQRISNVVSDKPLLLINMSQNPASCIWMGEGIWQWRMQEYVTNGNTAIFDELVTKTATLLITGENKKKFRYYPTFTEMYEGEKAVYNCETYNDLMEPVTGNRVQVFFENNNMPTSEYNFVQNMSNHFEIEGLKAGIYRYKAYTTLSGTVLADAGRFVVKYYDMERNSAQANFALLKTIAANNQGIFTYISQVQNLTSELLKKPVSNLITHTESYMEWIDFLIILFITIGVLSAEWILRKYYGYI